MDSKIKEYNEIISFTAELERLKNMTRTAWTSTGRQESVAEHSWRLAMLALVLEDYFPQADFGRVIRMCLVHDLGEAYEGDISATIVEEAGIKAQREEKALERLFAVLPDSLRSKLYTLCAEYNEGATTEARIAKAIDKMETIIQHNQGANPPDFDYAFNLEYGRGYALHDPVLKELRDIIDEETSKKARVFNNDELPE